MGFHKLTSIDEGQLSHRSHSVSLVPVLDAQSRYALEMPEVVHDECEVERKGMGSDHRVFQSDRNPSIEKPRSESAILTCGLALIGNHVENLEKPLAKTFQSAIRTTCKS